MAMADQKPSLGFLPMPWPWRESGPPKYFLGSISPLAICSLIGILPAKTLTGSSTCAGTAGVRPGTLVHKAAWHSSIAANLTTGQKAAHLALLRCPLVVVLVLDDPEGPASVDLDAAGVGRAGINNRLQPTFVGVGLLQQDNAKGPRGSLQFSSGPQCPASHAHAHVRVMHMFVCVHVLNGM